MCVKIELPRPQTSFKNRACDYQSTGKTLLLIPTVVKGKIKSHRASEAGTTEPSGVSEGGARGHDAPHSQHGHTSVCGLTGLAFSSEERMPGLTDTNSSGAGPIRRPGCQRHLTLPFRAAPGSVPARGSLLSLAEHSSLAPGHQPAPRGSERECPQLSPSSLASSALCTHFRAPGCPFSRSGSLRVKRGPGASALALLSRLPDLRHGRDPPPPRPSKGHSLGDLLISPRPSPVPGAVPLASAAPARFPARPPPPPWAPARHAPSRTPLRATTEAPKPGTQPGPPPSQTLAGRERPP